MTPYGSAALALALSLALGPIALVTLRRLRVMDIPTDRSSHSVATPRGGGVAVMMGALIGLAVAGHLPHQPKQGLLVAGAALALIGLVEDVRGISPSTRFGLQVVVAVGCLPFLVAHMRGPVVWEMVYGAGVVLWIVAYANGFNFMDGIDGISIAQAVPAGVVYWWLGRTYSIPTLATGGLVVVGASLGFAPLNLPRARVFLGDVGSYGIGGLLAALVVVGLRAGLSPVAVLAPVALFVGDSGITLALRIVRGETWYLPHRSHAYQRLVRQGWPHARVSLVVGASIALCAALGLLAAKAAPFLQAVLGLGVIGVVAGYLATPSVLERRALARVT